MTLKSFLISLSALCCAAIAYAVPARPGVYSFTQPDGSVVEASLVGDEYFHYYRSTDGVPMLRHDDGFLRATTRAEINSRMSMRKAAVAPTEIQRNFPTTGEVRGLIIMAEFQDLKFLEKTTPEYVDKKVNSFDYSGDETAGSVADFFREQSGGVFTPVFDVVGPVTLPKDRAQYGLNEDLVNFYRDACLAADEQADVDFSRYDVNNDYFVDFVFVIYPGHGEAQGGPAESIWPAMMDLSNYVYDYFDDMNLQVAACACELKGAEGEDWDGIGTICHEFSHILGLPDIYDATYSGGYGMAHFDIMDVGPYNADGRIPAGYTAMDRYSLGWLEATVLSEPAAGVELEPLVESNKAYFIVNQDNPNEFYTLENRQPIGFDAGLPGHGMIISYIHYDPQCWRRNTVNSVAKAGYEHVQLIAADNARLNTAISEAADPFPGTKNVSTFGDDTTPAAFWRTTDNKKPSHSLTSITESEDGVISFDFDIADAAVSDISAERLQIVSGTGFIIAPAAARVYNTAGMETGRTGLPAGIYLVKYGTETTKVMVR